MLLIAGERGGGRDSWFGLRGMLYRASARSAARFSTISYNRRGDGIVYMAWRQNKLRVCENNWIRRIVDEKRTSWKFKTVAENEDDQSLDSWFVRRDIQERQRRNKHGEKRLTTGSNGTQLDICKSDTRPASSLQKGNKRKDRCSSVIMFDNRIDTYLVWAGHA